MSKMKTMGLLAGMAAMSMLAPTPGLSHKSIYNDTPNGNSRRKHKENVLRRKKRRMVKKARSIQRAA